MDSPPRVAPGFFGNLRSDAAAGFLVFLLAVPLCLAVAVASGFPPVAGIWTAVVGGLLTSLMSNSELTIKGPAAGLIVIVAGSVDALGESFGRAEGLPEDQWAFLGYQLTLGIGVTAGVVQMLFGLVRAGRLVDLFPLTPVHGMVAGIGLIIIVNQAYVVLGVERTPRAGPLTLLAVVPRKAAGLNPTTALVGGVGLVVLFGLPVLARRLPTLKRVPAPVVVLLLALGLGHHFELSGPQFLVDMPDVLGDPTQAFFVPDFRGLATGVGLQYLLLFSLIGSLESLLSAKAVELLDPWRRKTNFDRDLLAVGAANTLAAAVGGLPMISEIVRSKANIDNGGRSRAANFVHGLCLLAFVLACPAFLRRIPLAALGAMLVFTGFRLASPKEFLRTYRVGSEQFLVFIGTLVATLATDLLTGLAVGIALEFAFQAWNGVPIFGLFRSNIDVVPEGDALVVLVVRRAAVFSNWLGLRKAILANAAARREVVVDLSRTRLVEHSVLEKLNELAAEFREQGKTLKTIGLDQHRPLSGHPHAVRKETAVGPEVPKNVS